VSDSNKKKSWFGRHKVLTGIIVIVVLFVLVGVAGGGDTANNSSGGSSSGDSKEYRFAERADKQDKDVEVVAGEPATVGGVKLTVSKVEYKPTISEYETPTAGKTYVVADVVLENTSDETRPYNTFDFRIQTAGGQVLDGAFASVPTPLNSGDMVAGGKAQGQVVFEVPVEDGHQYIIWKPGFDSARAIIQAK
jgi:hypothetical protein